MSENQPRETSIELHPHVPQLALSARAGELHPITPVYARGGRADPEEARGVVETIVQGLIDVFKPVVKVYADAARNVWQTLTSAGITPDMLREKQAMHHGRRYWTDTAGRIRRTSGRTPLLHNGRKPR